MKKRWILLGLLAVLACGQKGETTTETGNKKLPNIIFILADDLGYGYNCQRMGHHYYPYYLYNNQDSVLLVENAGKAKELYAPELIHQETLSFIEENHEGPFFCFVPTIIPHAELIAPEADMAQFRGKYLPEKAYRGYDDGPIYRQGPYESQAEPHAAFAAMIQILDRQVGEIVAKVEELGLEKNTLIVFTSDNGPHLEGGADPDYFDSNGPLRGYKRDLYDGGIRVPMIARWDGVINTGSKSDHISAFWDFVPTFAEMANTAHPEQVDGISFLPTFRRDEQAVHDYLYWESLENGGRKAVRKNQWKAVKYNILKHPEDSKIELYDLSTDLGEQNNVADQYPEIVKEMLKIMEGAHRPSKDFPFIEI